MMKSILITAALLAGAGMAHAQSDNHAAPGVIAPDASRVLPNGDVAPPPSTRAGGGVGATEVPFDNAQTRSGGPSGSSVRNPTGG